MRLANVIATSVQPQICVSVLCAVLLTVVQHALEDVGNGAVVASAVARSQNHDVAVPWVPRVAFPPSIVRHLPIPLWLCLEITGLRLIVSNWCWENGLSW